MNLVYLTERIDIEGGIQRSLTIRANYLVERHGHNITIVCTEKDTGIPAYKIDNSVKFVFLEKLTSKKSLWGRTFLRFKQAKMILKELNPDIVITPKFTLHNLFFHLIRSKAKFISEMREPKEQYNFGLGNSLKSKLNQRIRNYILGKQDTIVTLTERDKKSWGFNNIEVIPNPHTVKTETVSTLANTQVLAIGRLNKVKGFDKLLQVWKIVNAAHPEWRLKICGKGEEYLNLLATIHQLELGDSVTLTNRFLPVVPEFLDSSIFVLTSQFEAFGNVLVESKICGVPIVAFDAPNGPREIVIESKDGFVVALNDIEEMAKKIIYLIDNPTQRTSMGIFAKKDSDRYKVEVIVEQYNDMLIKTLNRDPAILG